MASGRRENTACTALRPYRRNSLRAALATPELSTGRRMFQAVAEGGALEDPAGFVKRVNRLLVG